MSEHVPPVMLDQRYIQIPDFDVKRIALRTGIYNAFPGGLQKIGSSLIAIYSSGSAHGQSDRQIWVRSDDEFETFTTGVFLENSTGAFDTSFLEDLIAPGETINFKSIFTIANEGGVLTPYTNSVIVVTDPYALWGTPRAIGSKWYTAGYRISGGYRRTALFESADGMRSWQFKTLIASVNTKQFSEADLNVCADGSIVCIIREDSSATDDLYRCVSIDKGATWSSPVLTSSHVKGNQPNLIRDPINSDLLMFAGIRKKNGSVTSYGNMGEHWDINGIGCWFSSTNGGGWSNVLMLAPAWASECGQPVTVDMGDGRIGLMFYTACGATTVAQTGIETGVYFLTFRPSRDIF